MICLLVCLRLETNDFSAMLPQPRQPMQQLKGVGFIWFQNLWFQDICIQIFDSYQRPDRWFQKICRQTLDFNDFLLRTPDSRMPDYRRAITWHMTTVPIPDTWFQDIWFHDMWFLAPNPDTWFRTCDYKTHNSQTNSGHLIPRLVIPKPIPDTWFQDVWCQNKLQTFNFRILILTWKPNSLHQRII